MYFFIQGPTRTVWRAGKNDKTLTPQDVWVWCSWHVWHFLNVLQGQDGEPGYPGPPGPSGQKVPLNFTLPKHKKRMLILRREESKIIWSSSKFLSHFYLTRNHVITFQYLESRNSTKGKNLKNKKQNTNCLTELI